MGRDQELGLEGPAAQVTRALRVGEQQPPTVRCWPVLKQMGLTLLVP
jgi:hypothetical protein